MKVSRHWLQDYVDLTDLSDEQIAEAITFLGFEVEGIEHTGAPPLDNVVVGEVLTRNPHPDADRLSVCEVAVGAAHGGQKPIVCGAQNYQVGDRIPVALVGAVLPGDFHVKSSRIRGEVSEGMMCSAKELQLGEDHAGLLILPDRPAVGTPINEILPKGDVVFDIEITPNRPDCHSHLGVARELAAWFRRELQYPNVKMPDAAAPRPDLLQDVRVDHPTDCLLYTATVMAGVTVRPSPDWLQQRLAAVGVPPINNLVDVGNFVMLEYGQPVHVFDAGKLGGQSIVVRRAKPGETLVTLDQKEHQLTKDMLLIADAQKPAVIAGIMGGEHTGVQAATTDLVLEVAVFRRHGVRATSRQLNLNSDSSYRFERGVDPHAVPEVINRAMALVLEIAGGTICGPTLKVGGELPWKREVLVHPAWVRSRLGFEVSDEDQRSALEALDLLIVREEQIDDQMAWTVQIPSWRADLDRPIDLVEEILRVHGTAKIPATTVKAPGLLASDDLVARYHQRAGAYLVGQDFHECVTHTLRSVAEVTAWGGEEAVDPLGLENPIGEDQSHLRPSLVGGLLDALQLNQARGNEVTRLFETGRVFCPQGNEVMECAAVGFVIAENRAQVWKEREASDFYSAKRLVESLAAMAAVNLVRQPHLETETPLGWQSGQHTLQGNMKYGWTARYGLLDGATVKARGIEGQVLAGLFAIVPGRIKSGSKHPRFQSFSLQPVALRDLALVVDESIPAGEVTREVTKLARQAAPKSMALEQVKLFDVYCGKGLSDDKKSLAFSLQFRAQDRTLKDEEVNAVLKALLQLIATKTSYEVRQ